MYKIEKENLEALFRKIAESQDLIIPIKKAGQTNFGLWNEGEEADLDTLKTVKSGKDAFFPQSETLYTCVRDGKKLTVEPEELRSSPFVVFGMKACDVKVWKCWIRFSLQILLTLFMLQEETMELSLQWHAMNRRVLFL